MERQLDPVQASEQWRREQRKIIEDRERKMAAYQGNLVEELVRTPRQDGEHARQTLLKLDEAASKPGHALPYLNKMQMLE